MKHVERIQEIRQAFDCIKGFNEEWFTNFYVEDDRLKNWIGKGQLFLISFVHNLFILRKRKDFFQCYFISVQKDDLIEDFYHFLKKINSTVVLDLVGIDNLLKKELRKAGFEYYQSLTRMYKLSESCKQIIHLLPDAFAQVGDEKDVMGILYENMDPLCEQLPDFDEIEAAVRNHTILVNRSQESMNIRAVLFFQRVGVTAYLRFWATKKQYHGKGYGRQLYQQYLQLNADAKRYVLWVRDDNLKVRRMYENYGMEYEKMQDFVYVFLQERGCCMK